MSAGTLLLVGNPTPLREHIKQHATELSFTVWVSDCPREARALITQNDIDVAVLNLKDFAGEGLSLLEGLKKIRPVTEVITLTVPSALRLSIESMKQGAFADVLMPVNLEELSEKIAEAWKVVRKKKRSLRYRLENLAVSASFAEAGDFATARTVIESETKS